MDNFQKINWESINGVTTITSEHGLIPRSMVVLNANGRGINVAAKVRNTDKRTVLRAFVKALLTEERQVFLKDSQDAAKASNWHTTKWLKAIMQGNRICITDKYGHILSASILQAPAGMKFRDVLKVQINMPLYKLVVKAGKEWTDPQVLTALDNWVTTAEDSIDYVQRLDKALGAAADSNYNEALAAAMLKRAQMQAERANA